jgi:hypothetical protein
MSFEAEAGIAAVRWHSCDESSGLPTRLDRAAFELRNGAVPQGFAAAALRHSHHGLAAAGDFALRHAHQLAMNALSLLVPAAAVLSLSRIGASLTPAAALLRVAGCVGGCSLLAACVGADPAASGQDPGNPPAASANAPDSAAISSGRAIASPARDGNIAIREEFDAAVKQNSAEAFELFVLRHPDHPLAKEARQRIAQLRGEMNSK